MIESGCRRGKGFSERIIIKNVPFLFSPFFYPLPSHPPFYLIHSSSKTSPFLSPPFILLFSSPLIPYSSCLSHPSSFQHPLSVPTLSSSPILPFFLIFSSSLILPVYPILRPSNILFFSHPFIFYSPFLFNPPFFSHSLCLSNPHLLF